MNHITFRTAGTDTRLELLTRTGPLTPKLQFIHELMRRRFDFVDRLAVAVFDNHSSQLKTYISSNVKEDPLELYEFPLFKAKSLMESLVKGPRVVNDLSVFADSQQDHTRKIREAGFQASYTVPILRDHAFHGFIFVNSLRKDCFSAEVIAELDVYCHLIGDLIEHDMREIAILDGALDLLSGILQSRSIEREARRNRMTRITRLIARELVAAGKCPFDDETIERIARFAAFHDIGKLTVPESILNSPGRLTPEEFSMAALHATRGLELVNRILKSFGLEGAPGVDLLRNIVHLHHERADRSGYPQGLGGKEIPLEARIIAVADVYDAMTSDRPYRFPFSSEETLAWLQKQEGKFDDDCVAALVRCSKELEDHHGTLPGS